MIAATADTRPPLGSALSARPPVLPCLPLPRRRAGHQRNGFSFFLSGRQCLGRSGREDERQDLFVVHWHSGLAFCPWCHITAALPARVFWAGGCLCIPVPTDKQGPSLRAFCPQQVLAELSPLCWRATPLGTEPLAGTAMDMSPLVPVPFGTGSPMNVHCCAGLTPALGRADPGAFHSFAIPKLKITSWGNRNGVRERTPVEI